MQMKMFFKETPDQLEEVVQKWLELGKGVIADVTNFSQCEFTDPATNIRGILLTIFYRART